MHEHYKEYGLINMNGRLYDPIAGRMLSPDIYVQDPTNSQNYNRYSYVLNNPLKYTDPSGWRYMVLKDNKADDPPINFDNFYSNYGGGSGGGYSDIFSFGNNSSSSPHYNWSTGQYMQGGNQISFQSVQYWLNQTYTKIYTGNRSFMYADVVSSGGIGYGIIPVYEYRGSNNTQFGGGSGNTQSGWSSGDKTLGLGLSFLSFGTGIYNDYVHNHTTYTTTKGEIKEIAKVKSIRSKQFSTISKMVKGIALGTSILSTGYSYYDVRNQLIQSGGEWGHVDKSSIGDAIMGTIGVTSTVATYVLPLMGLTNPIGFGVGITVTTYFAVRLIFDTYNYKP